MNKFKYVICLLLLVSSYLSAQLPIDSIGYYPNEKIPAYIILSDKERTESVEIYRGRFQTDIYDNISEKEKIYQADRMLTSLLDLPYDITLEFQQSNIDEEENIHLSFHQYYKGIKVDGSRYNVHYKGDMIESVNGDFRTINDIPTKPSITESSALAYALEHVGASVYMWENPDNERWIKEEQQNITASFYPVADLVIYLREEKACLCYKFDIYSSIPFGRYYVYINAINGKVEGQETRIHSVSGTAATRFSGARAIETQAFGNAFRLHDYSRGNGVITYNMRGQNNYASIDYIDNDNNWTAAEWHNANNDDAALDAHWGAMMTYDYFKTKHRRNSFDNKNTALRSYVNTNLIVFGYSNNDNAFWDGERMTYGSGSSGVPFTPIDVVGHEITHGVTSSSSNLTYSYESGALNEGFSDIFGAMVEHYGKGANTMWTIGEDLPTRFRRYLNNPKLNGQPDTYNGTNWHTGSQDNGGVHTNSGVLNYWFYLLAVGGSGTNDRGNTYNVQGIGLEKAANIAYTVLVSYLSPSSNYSACRNSSIVCATGLYGSESFEVVQVTNAWYAVGVGAEHHPVIIGPAYICPGQTVVYEASRGGSGYQWELPSDLQLVSGQGTSKITVKPIDNSGVQCTVKYTRGSETSSKKVFKGVPVISSVSGPTQVKLNGKGYYSAYPVVNNGNDFIAYNWIVSPMASVSHSANRQQIEVTFSRAGNYTIVCQGLSPCGNQGTGGTIRVTVSAYSSFINQISPYRFNVGLESENKDFATKEQVAYELYNQSTGILQRKGKINSAGDFLDFSGFPKGVYLLIIQIADDNFDTHKIIL